jgi:aspartyl-tRNA(Asn)/glutamyl-tRNA(Gln) amidotransferase subunit A
VNDPVAHTENCLARIARWNGELGAFTAVDADGARAAAAQAAARIAQSAARSAQGTARPLEGMTVGIKANIDVEGLATTAGVAARRDAIATSDAAVVRLLRDAGAIILGQVNMHEAALGATTDNEAYGAAQNPHRIGHTPGGSSGGSGAAVAAGLCDVALGTDTLGSVRIPAAYCGVYALKPTNGLVDGDGLVALAPRLDCIGPLARSVADLARVMAVLADLDAAQAVTRVATLDVVATVDCQPAVLAGLAAAVTALRGMGIAVEACAAPGLDLRAVRSAGFIEAARDAAGIFAADRDAGGISDRFAALLDYGANASADRLAAGAAAVAAATAALLAVLADHDVILLPSAPQAAFRHGAVPGNQADFTALANISGLPALSLPAGWSDDGLPVAVQIIGRPNSEATLLALAARLDKVLAAYRPPFGFD